MTPWGVTKLGVTAGGTRAVTPRWGTEGFPIAKKGVRGHCSGHGPNSVHPEQGSRSCQRIEIRDHAGSRVKVLESKP